MIYPTFLRRFVQKNYQRIRWTIDLFISKDIGYKASALSFSLFFSIVPLMALLFAIARGFGLDDFIIKEINRFFATQPEVAHMLLNFTNKYLIHAKSGIFIGSGIVILLYTFSKLLYNIEDIFNQIWNIKKTRNLQRRITNYLCAVIYLPLFIILNSGVSVFFSQSLAGMYDRFPWLHAFPLSRCIPYVLMIVFLCFIYMIIPNTKVPFRKAFLTAIPVGIVIQLLLYAYINMQIFTTSYNAIYGSFAAIPIAMFWVQILWYVVLFGAIWIYILSNEDELRYAEHETCRVAYHKHQLQLLHLIAYRFKHEETGTSLSECSQTLQFNRPYLEALLEDLVTVNLIHATPQGYFPSIDTTQLTVARYLKHIAGIRPISTPQGAYEHFIHDMLQLPYAQELIVELNFTPTPS